MRVRTSHRATVSPVAASRLARDGEVPFFVIEQAEGNYSAYVPDLPGCVATGATIEEVESEMREAIAFHIEGMKEDGLPIPSPSSQVEYLEIAA